MTGNESDDEPLVLSSHALDALKDFYAERDAHNKKFAELQSAAEARAAAGGAPQQPLSMEAFTEDWNESQFWYSDETARLLAGQLLEGAGPEDTVAVVSAPSVFVALKNLVAERGPDAPAPPKMVLLEHDNRFAVFGDEFVFYDFVEPFKLPGNLKGAVTRIICDPPFLSEDCQTKAAMTVRWLAKPSPTLSSSSSSTSQNRLVVCTGERMEELVTRLYKSFGVRTTTYEPVHARGLSNEFYCYASFECGEWRWKA
ncbi:uncharacterized protein E0L32_009178 [Thyridium curvatum]|uniref:Protein-lysine N-methyltransferase EFM5 n=1 Tax=Thyridium curvatum TaxID=1093900 RepID=A0A507AQ88_9PEZI|nr:uncharacterized protein E0L32_009178 [Thyridium curvatum]TPX09577.1 hypothetical protein E0L32_009178 [Thyridium curvatum]